MRAQRALPVKRQVEDFVLLFGLICCLHLGNSFSVQFSPSVMSDSLRPHGLQHARLPGPLPTPRAYSNSCPPRRWCHPSILSSVDSFSSCLQSFPASGSFPMSRFFESSGQSIGASASASVLPFKYSGLISFRVDWFDLLAIQEALKSLPHTTVQKHQFFGAWLSL